MPRYIKNHKFEGVDLPIAIGDVVWFFFDASPTTDPAPAVVAEFGEDNMLTLEVLSGVQPGRARKVDGVCMHHDGRLNNQNFRKRGSWAPRGVWSFNK